MDEQAARTRPGRSAAAYGLQRPDLAFAQAAVRRILSSMCDGQWPRLLSAARLTGAESDPASFSLLLDAMDRCGDPVLRLCACSLRIRLDTHSALSAVHGRVTRERARSTPPSAMGAQTAPRATGPLLRRAAAGGAEVALLDRSGVIVRVNHAWHEFCAANGGGHDRDWVGQSYLAACVWSDDPTTVAVVQAIRAALRGDLPHAARIQIPCHSPQEDRWYDMTIRSRYSGTGACVGATITLTLASRAPSTT